MATIFCANCGSKAEYQFSAPNFCGKCGKSYSRNFSPTKSLLRSSLKSKNAPKNEGFEDFDDNSDENSNEHDDSDDISYSNSSTVPRLRKIDVEIDSETDVRVFKFEDFLNNSPTKFQKPKDLDFGP
jgi:hypothetical protein